MAITNKERVGRGLDLLRDGLRPWVEQELRATYNDKWLDYYPQANWHNGLPKFDAQALLNAIIDCWKDTFSYALSDDKELLDLAHVLRKVRNKFAHDHNGVFTKDDTLSALIGMQKMLEVIKAPQQAEAAEKLKLDVITAQYEGIEPAARKKAGAAPIGGITLVGLKPWRDIVVPHEDVQKGTYQQAEFAADLWQVYKGQGSSEYLDPVEFFHRTFLTAGLKELLVNGLKRLTANGGDPVVELQINFGGGKTHSMLALYHLFSGVSAADLPGIEEVLKSAGANQPPAVRRAVLVGTELRPGMPLTKDDGTVVKTLWGEMAWQLDGKAGYEIVRLADETATNPGDALDELFQHCGPSLILIDEWVAYARQLYNRHNMLPAGDFDTQFTFAQALSQSARRSKCVQLVVSVPASISEQGDMGGQSALNSLQQAIGRQNLVWRPATSDESFEIVRRRLFQTLTTQEHHAERDAVITEFCNLYRANPMEFPTECREAEYERRMRASYPIHPELFDRLYEDWSTLEKFQRTRGVLKLMATVIHQLWESGDRSYLILPATVPISDMAVQTHMTRYLDERWSPIIDKDVDGPNSTPLHLDNENSNFGRYSACRRVARTVYLGTAPSQNAAVLGIEDKRIKLGCCQPKEVVATFGDALRKLSDSTAYLYSNNGQRYWYSTQPSVNSLAKERAEKIDPYDVNAEIVRRLKEMARSRGDFAAMRVAILSSELPDEKEVCLVVLGPDRSHKQGNIAAPASAAITEAASLLKNRGSSLRNYQNMLVFLAPDQQRLPALEQSIRQYLAWRSIVEEADTLLDLTPYNKQQATTKVTESSRICDQQINEAYQWVLAPKQPPKGSPPDALAWQELRAQGSEGLAIRTAKKLKNEEDIIYVFGGYMLRREIDNPDAPLWQGDHVSVKELEAYFARYLYLPRLKDMDVLQDAIRDGVQSAAWETEGFAYADSYDETKGTYIGLKTNQALDGSRRLNGLLVKPEAALAALAAISGAAAPQVVVEGEGGAAGYTTQIRSEPVHQGGPVQGGTAVVAIKKLKRFHGQVTLDPQQLTTGVGKISAEVLQHLISVLGSKAVITLEIQVTNDDGFSESAIRTVTENCRTLKFDQRDFEEE